MLSAFADMEEAVPHFSSSAASQKAKFSPVEKHGRSNEIYVYVTLFTCTTYELSLLHFHSCSHIHMIMFVEI